MDIIYEAMTMFLQGLPSRQIEISEVRNDWLGSAASAGRLTVVCGAGLSMKYKVPSWRELATALGGAGALDGEVGGELTREERLEQFIERKFKGDRTKFADRVRSVLYRSRPADWDKFGTRLDMEALAVLCLKLREKGRVRIVSFNYDSYLEEFLRKRGLNVKPHIDPLKPLPAAEVVVLHPHGFLPFDENATSESRHIILDQRAYAESRMSSWWPVCEECMANNICVFIGLSGRCPNLDYLLTAAHKHQMEKRGGGHWGIACCRSKEGDDVKRWRRRGIYGLSVGAAYRRTPQVFADIIAHM